MSKFRRQARRISVKYLSEPLWKGLVDDDDDDESGYKSGLPSRK